MRFANMDEFRAHIASFLPMEFEVYENVDGELSIVTGLSNDGDNGVIPTNET